MVPREKLSLAFGLMAINNELLKPDIWDLVRRQTMNIPTYYMWNSACKSTFTNILMIQNITVVFCRFIVHSACPEIISFSQQQN